MISVLKFFRIADGQLAIFNDHRYIQSKKIENVIKKSREKKKKIPIFFMRQVTIEFQKIN